jgi:16S rRNA (uracil1498-N3)-methyltransferase
VKRASHGRHRFAVGPEAVSQGQIRFPARVARQMRRVLRLTPGDVVTAFDGQGSEYTVSLVSLRDEGALGAIEARREGGAEPRLRITLYQALLPREKFEVVLQKGTEVGVAAFVPLETERSLVKGAALDARRLERWRRIVAEAAEQSGRVVLPGLAEPLTFRQALEELPAGPALLAWERETSLSVREALMSLKRRLREGPLALFVGPEGGFTEAEALAARAAGAVTISLGPRVLRAETAGLVLAALSLYQAGALEPVRTQPCPSPC